jgi:hypothetical protein
MTIQLDGDRMPLLRYAKGKKWGNEDGTINTWNDIGIWANNTFGCSKYISV